MKESSSILVFSLISILSSCSINISSFCLKEAAKPASFSYESYNTNEYKSYFNKILNSQVNMIKKFNAYNDGDYLISPTTIFNAFSMLELSTINDNLEEVKAVIGVDEIENKENYEYYFSKLNKEFEGGLIKSLNSIWLSSKLKDKYDTNTLDTLANDMFANSYEVDFANEKETFKVIDQYIKSATNNLLNADGMKFDSLDVAMLLNTLYIKDLWNKNKDLSETKETYSFKNEDGSEYQTKLLYKAKVSGKPIIEEAYKKFYVNTCNGYELEFIVPNVNYKINDVFELSEIDQLLKENSYINSDDDYIYYTNVYFPSFSIEGNYELIDFFKEEYNLTSLFNPSFDYTLLEGSPIELVTSSILHKNKLSVEKEGIEGASYTSNMIEATSPDVDKEIKTYNFYVDKGFIFNLKSSDGNILFSGTVSNLSN